MKPRAEQEKAKHVGISPEGIENFQSRQGKVSHKSGSSQAIQQHLRSGQSIRHQQAVDSEKQDEAAPMLPVKAKPQQRKNNIYRQQCFNKPQMPRSDSIQVPKCKKIKEQFIFPKAI